MKRTVKLILSVLLIFSLLGCGGDNNNDLGYYTVSGQIVDGQGRGVDEVRVTFSHNFVAVRTDSNGQWLKERLRGEVTVTPIHDQYSFEPRNRKVSGSSTSVDFTMVKVKIDDVEVQEDIYVDYGALPEDFLPQEVKVSLDNGEKVKLEVDWDGGTPTYDPTEAGDYLFTGDFILPGYIENPLDLKAQVIVKVSALYVWGVDPVKDFKVNWNTPIEEVGLPDSIIITLNTFDRMRVDLLWDEGTPIYNPEQMGIYEFIGALILPEHIENPNRLTAKTRIIVQKNIVDVEKLKKLEVPYGTPLEEMDLPETVEVTMEDASIEMVDVYWDEGTPPYDPTVANEFIFTGELDLPEYVVNPSNLKARIVVDIITYTISGRVIEDGVGLEGVEILFSENLSKEVTDEDGFWRKDGLKGPIIVQPSMTSYLFEPEKREVRGPAENLDFIALKKTATVSVNTLLFGPLHLFMVRVHSVENVPRAEGFTILDVGEEFKEFGEEIVRSNEEDSMPLFILDGKGEDASIVGYVTLDFEDLVQTRIPLLP